MRENLNKLYSIVSGQKVFIVGGGYSVNDVDLSYLDDKITLAINDAYKILPEATALYWCDCSWVGRESEGLKNHQTELRFMSRHNADAHIRNNMLGPGNSTLLKLSGDYGYDPNPDNVKGNNSGTQAINLMVNMNASEIYLIGFDMRDNPLKRNQTHWHDHHTLVVRPDIYRSQFIPSMIQLDKDLRNSGVKTKIFNCSKTSAIPCFEKVRVPGLNK